MSTWRLRLSLDLQAITVRWVYFLEHGNGKEKENNQAEARTSEAADAAAVELA
jgi:hypothetical protein